MIKMKQTVNTIEDLEQLPIKVSYMGETKKEDWECFMWRVDIASSAGIWSTSFYTGKGRVTKPKHPYMEPKPKKPTNADILYSLVLDANASNENFHDWCANYGYSSDSIQALNTYKECLEIGNQLNKHFGRDLVNKLTELLQEY
jgi:hypothetical protein